MSWEDARKEVKNPEGAVEGELEMKTLSDEIIFTTRSREIVPLSINIFCCPFKYFLVKVFSFI